MQIMSECLCLSLRMASRASATLYDSVLQPTELTSSQFSVLRNIYRFRPTGVSNLADIMLSERTTTTRNIDLLEARGLVSIENGDRDSRVRRPVLTEEGIEKLRAAVPRWRMAQRRILAGLGSHGWGELRHTLNSAAMIGEEGPELCEEPLEEYGGAPSDDSHFDPITIRRCINSTLQGAARVVTRQYDAVLRDQSLKITQFHLLAAIDENPSLRPVDLGHLLLLDQASMTLSIASLRKIGWVAYAPRGRDGKGLSLTAEGQAKLNSARTVWQEYQTRKLGDAAQGDANRWSASLSKMLSAALRAKMN